MHDFAQEECMLPYTVYFWENIEVKISADFSLRCKMKYFPLTMKGGEYNK